MWAEKLGAVLLRDGKLTIPALIGLFCLAGALSLAVFAVLTGSHAVNRATPRHGASRKGPVRSPGISKGRFWQKTYLWMSQSRLTRRFLRIVRNRLELSSGYDERGLRRHAARILLVTGILMAVLMTAFSLLSQDLLLCVIFAGMLGFLADTVLDVTVTRVGNRLLTQQVRFHEQLRHRFYEERSIDGAMEGACQAMRDDKAHEMYAQGEKLLDMLTAADPDSAFENYRLTAPNRFLKLLAGMCSMTREYGDTRHEGGSVFLRGLGHLSEEIRSELFKRERLTYAMRSLGILTLLPLFFLRPVRSWAGGSFAPMEQFYAKGIGTILELLMIGIALACHAGIRTLQHQGDAVPVKRRHRQWEEVLLQSFFRPLLHRLIPGRFTVLHQQRAQLLRRAVSPLRVQDLVCRQVMASLFIFLLLVGFSLFLQFQQNQRILHEPDMPVGFLGGRLSATDEDMMRAQLAQDRQLLLSLPRNATRMELEAIVAATNLPADVHKETLARLESKLRAMQNNRFWWWKMALCLSGLALGWQLPVWYLRYQAKVRAMDLEDEVARFQTMILMLMHMPRMDVEEILQWMEMFSLHFREPLQTCLSDFSAGAVEALEALRAKILFEPMTALVGDLILAATNLPIAQAFEELDSEKQWTKDKRRAMNEQIVERKRNLGQIIGFAPLYALIGLYLMLPMIAASMSEMQRFYQQMSSF